MVCLLYGLGRDGTETGYATAGIIGDALTLGFSANLLPGAGGVSLRSADAQDLRSARIIRINLFVGAVVVLGGGGRNYLGLGDWEASARARSGSGTRTGNRIGF